MKVFVPVLSGIVGAAQISTAHCIARPQEATDVLLTGAAGRYLVWSVPLGALLGVALGCLLVRSSGWDNFWRDGRKAFLWATASGFFVAPLAPGMLGLSPQSTAELWQGLAVVSLVAWTGVAALSLGERYL